MRVYIAVIYSASELCRQFVITKVTVMTQNVLFTTVKTEKLETWKEASRSWIKNTLSSNLITDTIHTLQSRDYHGYLEGKHQPNGDEQRPARGIAALQISNTTINQLYTMSQNVKIKKPH